MQVVQSNDLLFATLYLYRQDGTPYWASALLQYGGVGDFGSAYLFIGSIYETQGPWFGGVFDPSIVQRRPVGSMTFHLNLDQATGRLEYSIDGVDVVKEIQRQTLRNVQLAAHYNAYRTITATGCSNPANDLSKDGGAQLATAQTDARLSLTWTSGLTTCSFSGPYIQSGRIGSFDGIFSCTDGETGTAKFFDLTVGKGTFSGSWTAQSDTLGCTYDGRFSGIDVPGP